MENSACETKNGIGKEVFHIVIKISLTLQAPAILDYLFLLVSIFVDCII